LAAPSPRYCGGADAVVDHELLAELVAEFLRYAAAQEVHRPRRGTRMISVTGRAGQACAPDACARANAGASEQARCRSETSGARSRHDVLVLLSLLVAAKRRVYSQEMASTSNCQRLDRNGARRDRVLLAGEIFFKLAPNFHPCRRPARRLP
jgi:hypothetical protein